MLDFIQLSVAALFNMPPTEAATGRGGEGGGGEMKHAGSKKRWKTDKEGREADDEGEETGTERQKRDGVRKRRHQRGNEVQGDNDGDTK